MLELRHRPLAELLSLVQPFFEELGDALAGRPVTIVPGNHDHALAEPWLARLRLAGAALGAENEWPVGSPEADGPAGVIASWLPRSDVTPDSSSEITSSGSASLLRSIRRLA